MDSPLQMMHVILKDGADGSLCNADIVSNTCESAREALGLNVVDEPLSRGSLFIPKRNLLHICPAAVLALITPNLNRQPDALRPNQHVHFDPDEKAKSNW